MRIVITPEIIELLTGDKDTNLTGREQRIIGVMLKNVDKLNADYNQALAENGEIIQQLEGKLEYIMENFDLIPKLPVPQPKKDTLVN